MKEKQFQRYFQRLSVEGILRALLLALATGACAAIASGIVTWFKITDDTTNGWILALIINIGVLLAVTLLFTPIWYFLFFRPTIDKSAKRIDRLGLEERMITMVELQEQDSLMARLQREDAKQTLQSVTPGQIRISMPKKILVFLLIAFIGAVGTTTVSVLGALGYIYSGYDVVDAVIPEEPLEYVNVIYNSVDGGLVEGEFDQRIVRGEDTSEVLAVADDGYEFLQWSDGVKDPARIDYNVQGDMEIYALFQYVGEPQEDPNGDPTEDEDSQRPQQQEQENNSDTEESPDAPPMSSPTKYDAYNQVINGQTYFKDVLDQYKDAAREDMQNSGEADKEGNSIADAYYNILN